MATPPEYQGGPVIGKDIPWSTIDAQFCRIVHFTPFATIDGRQVMATRMMPYAVLTIESPVLPEQGKLHVTHRVDFLHLWEIFQERRVGSKEEVLLAYASDYHTGLVARFLKSILPRLHLYIFPKGSLEQIYDPSRVMQPPRWIAEWEPRA